VAVPAWHRGPSTTRWLWRWTQVGHNTPGRVYYVRKQAEGKTRKEAMRAPKRHISDAVYHRLLADTRN
jgi:hypothetical protein